MSDDGPAIKLVDSLIEKESRLLFPFVAAYIALFPSEWSKKYRRLYVCTWPISMPIRLLLCIPALLVSALAIIVMVCCLIFDKWHARMWAAEDKPNW